MPSFSEFPRAFHNIGIRIEDEVIVGKKHPIVLSVNAPKEVVLLFCGGYMFQSDWVFTDR